MPGLLRMRRLQGASEHKTEGLDHLESLIVRQVIPVKLFYQ
jgi:hypothetical protein